MLNALHCKSRDKGSWGWRGTQYGILSFKWESPARQTRNFTVHMHHASTSRPQTIHQRMTVRYDGIQRKVGNSNSRGLLSHTQLLIWEQLGTRRARRVSFLYSGNLSSVQHSCFQSLRWGVIYIRRRLDPPRHLQVSHCRLHPRSATFST
jgi:hypothetical protein